MTGSEETRQESGAAEFSLPRWLVGYARLAHPRTLRWTGVVVTTLSFLCVVSVFTHWSWLPLIPLPLFALAAYASRRVHFHSTEDILVVRWTGVVVASVLVGFFFFARVANYWL